jgi:hypothetical protein
MWDKFYANKVMGVEDLMTHQLKIITPTSTGMLSRTWKELEFRPDVLRATRGAGAHTEPLQVYSKIFMCVSIK